MTKPATGSKLESASAVHTRLQEELTARAQDETLRTIRNIIPISAREVRIDGKQLINFASNDYLGLSRHPELIERCRQAIDSYGAGTTSSRLVSGNIDLYERIEARLVALKGSEAALVFPSGFQLNATVLQALAGSETCFALDRLCHASIIAGTTRSSLHWFRFAHNDVQDLERKLTTAARRMGKRSPKDIEQWIVTESVFSMDGDQAPIDDLEALSARTGSCLYIDEAHATGVFGDHGMGLCHHKQTSGPAFFISMGTFGKGLGSFGAYIACPKIVKDYLINKCPGLIYSTALPPAVLAAIDAALDLVPAMKAERRRLLNTASYLRSQLQSMGYQTGASTTQIIPILVSSPGQALALSKHLEERGILVPAIRPPTVPARSCRLRISLSAAHTDSDVERLCEAIKTWRM